MNMDATSRKQKKHKFDISYVMAKEGIAFAKYMALYNLETQHNVNLGMAYKNVSAKSYRKMCRLDFHWTLDYW